MQQLDFPQFVHFERTEADIYNNDSLQDLNRIDEMRQRVIAMSDSSTQQLQQTEGLVSLAHIVSQPIKSSEERGDKIETYVMLTNTFEADSGGCENKTFIVKRIHLTFNDR